MKKINFNHLIIEIKKQFYIDTTYLYLETIINNINDHKRK